MASRLPDRFGFEAWAECLVRPRRMSTTAVLESEDFEETKDFYVGMLGLEVAMEEPDGDFLGLVSVEESQRPDRRGGGGRRAAAAALGIDVGDPAAVDSAHDEAVRRGLEVVYPLTDEPWGIRRFFVVDPTGAVVSILAHTG